MHQRLSSARDEGKNLIEKIQLNTFPFFIYERLKDLPYTSFLDSSMEGGEQGRFSFLCIEPFLIFKSKKDKISLNWQDKKETIRGNPFVILKGLFNRFKVSAEKSSPFPFTGGAVGYFSYDLKDFNETLPSSARDDLNIYDTVLCFYDTVLIFDHSTKEYFLASSGFPAKGKKRLYRQKARFESIRNKLLCCCDDALHSRHCEGAKHPKQSLSFEIASSVASLPPRNDELLSSKKLTSNFTKEEYIKTIEKAKKYIKSGDIYQVNLSQRFKVPMKRDVFQLYETLRTINPAPLASFLNFGDIKVISSSPERFLKKEGRMVETRPIKGTRPRGKNALEDKNLMGELISSIKDRAENLMIIDLERNDLGRICEYGSVKVSEFMACEKYATVFHLVSTVRGILRKDVGPIDCLMNCFPGGSITGAPKIRSMEIIEELEPVKRSVYTGSVGYIDFNGNMDTSIAIRTIIVKDRVAYFQAGGGIVYDSDPEKEYQETLDKAKALIEAITTINCHCEESASGGRRSNLKHEYSIFK